MLLQKPKFLHLKNDFSFYSIASENTKEENYTIHIKSNQKYVGDNKNLAIRPGMTLDADIITGKKTILDYILRPVLKTLQIEG